MKTKNILFALFMTIGLAVNAQDFTGTATYKTSSKMSITLDSTSMASGMQEELNAMLKKMSKKEYTLNFNKSESVWKEVESLGGPATSGGATMVMSFSSGGGSLYKNTKEKNYAQSKSLFGKPFLEADSLKQYDWKLESDTKQIGQYTCYKATYTREITRTNFTSFSDSDNKDEEGEESTKKVEKKMQTITAWYTPQIPVNHGPQNYWGLPGLILEVSNGGTVIICSKVVINPKEEVEIAAPTKGKKVSSEEYKKMLEEKMEEMNKMNEGGRKKGDGEHRSISIKIGG
mgnify:CR=1 FL=1